MRTIPAAVAAFLLVSNAAFAEDTGPPAPPQPPTPPEASAPPAPPAPPTETTAEDSEEQKVVCKKMDPPTGSRVGARKICHTVAEWRRINQTAKDTVNEIQTTDTRGPPGS